MSFHIYIYDEIVDSFYASWGFGVSAEMVLEALQDAKQGEEVIVHINSPGGFATESFAIYNHLAMHDGKIVTRIEALAASGAGIISQAGDEIEILENADFMAHEAWGGALGQADELRKKADRLDSVNEKQIHTFAKRWGESNDSIAAELKAEVWMNAKEMVASGLADTVLDPMEFTNEEGDTADLADDEFEIEADAAALVTRYKRTPERVLRRCSGLVRRDPLTIAARVRSGGKPVDRQVYNPRQDGKTGRLAAPPTPAAELSPDAQASLDVSHRDAEQAILSMRASASFDQA